jgi:hypothetical protein
MPTFNVPGLGVNATGGPSSFGAVLVSTGIATHQASMLSLDQRTSTASRLVGWGPNAATRGTIELAVASSDASAYVNGLVINNDGTVTFGPEVGGSELARFGGDIRLSGSIVLHASTSANSGMRVDTSGTTRFKGTDKTILNNGITSALSDGPVGWFRVTSDDNEGAEFFVRGGGHSVTKISETTAGIFSVTAGNAGTINVYWDAGNSRYSIENKRGGTRVCTLEFIGQ